MATIYYKQLRRHKKKFRTKDLIGLSDKSQEIPIVISPGVFPLTVCRRKYHFPVC